MTEVQGTRRQFRRDFTAKYKCEGCGYIEEVSGYDDQNFHVNVVPSLKCEVWEPKEGELCYFWNDTNAFPYIAKSSGASHKWRDTSTLFRTSQMLPNGEYGTKYCAPFKGELPEAFKGLV